MSVKTFDLVPVLCDLASNSASRHLADQQIRCMDSGGKHLFVGTNSGVVIRYDVTESFSPNSKRTFLPKFNASKNVGSKKPVDDLRLIGKLNRVLYQCDGILGMIDAATVEIVPTGGSKLKNVLLFSLNDRVDPENPFIIYEICVARKRSLQLYAVQETHFSPVSEVPLHDNPCKMVYSDPFVCFASLTEYHIVNVKESSHIISDLFPYPDKPVILSIDDSDQNEFLLSGPGGLGMFVSARTLFAPRPPINWAELGVTRMQNSSPNILVFSDADVWVYGSINQQPKQSLQFENCRATCMWNFGSKSRPTPLMASSSQIWALENVPWQEQVELLLTDWRVEEAVQVARSFYDENEENQQQFRHILFRSALIEIQKDELTSAKNLLLESGCSPEDVLSYCPDLWPNSSGKGDGNILLFASENEKVRRKRDEFLLNYLEESRRTRTNFYEDLNLVMLKLFCSSKHCGLLSFVKSYQNPLPTSDAAKVLEEHERYLSLAYLHLKSGATRDALTVFMHLLDGVLHDPVDGAADVFILADIIKSFEDETSFMSYIPWLLKRDESVVLDLLRTRELSNPIDLVDMLEGFPSAKLLFLEMMVFERKSHASALCTMLALEYLRRLESSSDLFEDASIRKNLQEVIGSDIQLDTWTLFPLIDQLQLHLEKVILLGKDGKHFEALEILTQQLKDRNGAVNYCVKYGASDSQLKRTLFEHLLGIYFHPRDQTQESVEAALELLNHEHADFDSIKVLSVLPANWPLASLKAFLTNTMRRNLHDRRMDAVEKSLSKQVTFHHSISLRKLTAEKILLIDERRCDVCRKRFTDCSFTRTATGRIQHIIC